jgi:hypothetical protein
MRLTKIFLPLTLGVLLSGAPVFAADWQPIFTPGQAVYIDPALVSSKTAPVTFGAELERELKVLKDKSGVNYYVWAVQANNAPMDKPLGVAKTDEAIMAWGGQASFPNDNYALIVWARRAENPSKGGVGINLSLGQKTFEVKPFLKGRMPQNPKGAILAIADHVSDNKIAQVNEAKASKEVGAFFSALGAILLVVFGWLAAALVVWALIKALKPNFLYKKEAQAAVEKWSKAVKNATDIYLELTSDDVIEFYSLLAKSLESNQGNKLQVSLDLAKAEISRFLCIYEKCRVTGDALEKLLSDSEYKTVCLMIDDVIYSVDFGTLPIEKASIFGGLNDVKEYKGIDLLNALDKSMSHVLSAITKVKYDKTTPEKAVANVYVEQDLREREEAARTSATVIVDNSRTSYGSSRSSHRSSDDSSSSSRSSDSSSSSSDWGSSGSDYSSSDSGSFGGDY